MLDNTTKNWENTRMNDLINLREKINEDIVAYMRPLLDRDYEFTELNVGDLCQIVVNRINALIELQGKGLK